MAAAASAAVAAAGAGQPGPLQLQAGPAACSHFVPRRTEGSREVAALDAPEPRSWRLSSDTAGEGGAWASCCKGQLSSAAPPPAAGIGMGMLKCRAGCGAGLAGCRCSRPAVGSSAAAAAAARSAVAFWVPRSWLPSLLLPLPPASLAERSKSVPEEPLWGCMEAAESEVRISF